jgi:nucleotide-binding universal stress UspA family protein
MDQPIVVGIDGTEESMAAAHWAADEAALRQRPLRLLHVWEWSSPPGGQDPGKEERREAATRLVLDAQQELAGRHPGLPLSGEQLEGPAIDTLLAATTPGGLLVLGSRGMGRLAGFLVGSVAFRVVGRAHHPLALVRAGYRPGADAQPGGEVVTGVDLVHRADRVLEYAFEAARLRGRGLHVINAYVPPSVYGMASSVSLTGVGQTPVERERALEAEVRPWRAKFPEVPVRLTTADGSPVPRLAEAAEHAPLLVIGRREPEARVGPTLGSVAYGVLHHAVSPVAVIPHT